MRKRVVALLAALLLVVASCGDDGSTAAAEPVAMVDIGAGLTGQEGLAASVYATGLEHVAGFAFDAEGRLWVATAAFEDVGDDAVYVVPDAGADPVLVITDAYTPLGLLWVDDELYVSSRGRVDAYSAFDGTAFASSREVVVLPDGVGEVNGLARSPDGRIVLGISAPCDACVPESAYSAAVVSFLPDGSDLRLVAGGIRAAVGLAYFPGTSDLFVTMNQRDDLDDATPGDWLAVVQQGDDWGFPDCYGQDDDACAGVPEPVAVLDEHAAVSGVAIVTGELGASIGTAAVVAEWATSSVVVVPLATTTAADGTTAYTGTMQPLLTGLDNPVAVTLAPDGALLVGDWTTGTVYRVTTA